MTLLSIASAMELICEVPNKMMYAVEIPAALRNDDNLREMLGGATDLSRTFQSKKRRLKLSFRPHMLYAKGIYADRTQGNALLLSVRCFRNRSSGERKIVLNPLSTVRCVYKFLSLSDFQFGPFTRSPILDLPRSPDHAVPDKYDVFYDQMVIRHPSTSLDPFLQRDIPLFLPPLHFIRHDIPIRYGFASRYRSSEYIEMEEKSQLYPVARKPRHSYLCTIGFEEPTPAAPSPPTMRLLSTLTPISETLCSEVRELFTKRPIWMRGAVMHHTKIDRVTNAFKYAVFSNAYYMTGGPWSRSLIRFGYDPRTDPESRFYQVIDFRLNSHVAIRKILERRLSGTFFESILEEQGSKGLKSCRTDFNPLCKTPHLVESDEEMEDSKFSSSEFRFSSTHLPKVQQLMVCLIDVDIPAVKQILKRHPVRESCDSVDGWLDTGSITKIRELMAQSLEKWLSEGSHSSAPS